MRAEELNNYFILGVDLGSQHTLSAILVVEDMGVGNSWDEINIKANNHLENFQVYIGDVTIPDLSGSDASDGTTP